jgi:hypothetical protein
MFKKTLIASSLSLLILSGSVLAETDLANPVDQKLQIQFDRYHRQLTWFYSINMFLGLSLFYIHGKEMTRFSIQRTESR